MEGRMAGEPVRPLLETLLAVHREAFELREHAVSYHALAAAAHAAETLEELDALDEVARLGLEELAWIDAHDPGHRLSSASAATRRHPGVFEQLAVTARGMRQRIEADRRREDAVRARTGVE
jgi:hypothetical protein